MYSVFEAENLGILQLNLADMMWFNPSLIIISKGMQISWIQLSDYKTTLQMNKDINMRKIVPRKNLEVMKKSRKPDFISLKGHRKL